jgi:hypothetical protein
MTLLTPFIQRKSTKKNIRKIDKKPSYAIFPYKNNNHIFYDYSEINQKGPPVRKTY